MDIVLKDNERIDDLEINDLKIIQNKDGFCFGIDSVLISDFAKEIKSNSKIIDLGTGTAIIPILLTAKIESKEIIGVEIQDDVAEMATRSIKLNNLEGRVKIINEDLKKLHDNIPPNITDVVITNPPYMKNNTGIKNENISKLISRHEIKCTLEDIAEVSKYLLKNYGELYMVHRPDRLVDIVECLRKNNLEIKKMRFVFPKKGEQANLILIEAVKNAKPFLKVLPPLYVYNKDGTYTDEIRRIYNKI